MQRQSRKLDHLKYSMLLTDGPLSNCFADFSLLHNCLPDLSWDDIKLDSSFAGIAIDHPVIINAITGGANDVAAVNAQLAEVARLTNSVMAVGSQYAALEDPEVQNSYQIVRKKNPNGIILANLGAHVSIEQAKRAVEMVGAQAIQIHLNSAQEIIMTEGDRNFSGYLRNIAKIACKIDIPVIAKEVGFGIAREQAQALVDAGVRAIDTGGAGGTNFLAIEAARNQLPISQDTLSWGIPTAISAVEVANVLPDGIDLIVSGGIRTALDAVKSMALGGVAVGIAAPAIKILLDKDLETTVSWLQQFLTDIKRYMLLLGIGHCRQLTETPVIITGYSRDWLTVRGIDICKYALRKNHG